MTVTPFPYDHHAGPVDRARSSIELLPAFIDLAQRIAKTEFVPSGLRNRPEAVLAALMSGAERGLGPMESLRSINVIEGKPSLSAEAMRALVLAAGHDIDILENTATRATVVGRRAGSDSTSPPFTWTIERARRAKLANRGPWLSYPEAMLLARASTDLCRAVFPDVIAGLASVEEATDLTTEDAPKTTRRARGATAPATEPPALREAPSGQSDAGVIETTDTGADLGGIPGSDRPSWGNAPRTEPSAPAGDPPLSDVPDASQARRLHALVGQAFPNADAGTQARYRHALVAVMTRKRGPVLSSSLLTMEEQLAVSDALVQIVAGQASITDEPDGVVMFRARGWQYAVSFDPLTVEVNRAGSAPADNDAGTLPLDEA